ERRRRVGDAARPGQPQAARRHRARPGGVRRRSARRRGAVEARRAGPGPVRGQAPGGRRMKEPWWIAIIEAFIIANLVRVTFAYLTWLERKALGRMQLRYGPNRAGPFGLLQPIADLIKLVRKEAFSPSHAIEPVYIIAPIVSMFTALAAFSVIPFGPGWK